MTLEQAKLRIRGGPLTPLGEAARVVLKQLELCETPPDPAPIKYELEQTQLQLARVTQLNRETRNITTGLLLEKAEYRAALAKMVQERDEARERSVAYHTALLAANTRRRALLDELENVLQVFGRFRPAKVLKVLIATINKHL